MDARDEQDGTSPAFASLPRPLTFHEGDDGGVKIRLAIDGLVRWRNGYGSRA